MKRSRTHNILDVLAEMDPSFQRLGPDVGRLTADRFPVAVTVHHDALDWCTLTLPLPQPPDRPAQEHAGPSGARVLQAHHWIGAPVKFARDRHVGRYYLVGEIPPDHVADAGAIKAMLAGIRDGLAQAISTFNSIAACDGMCRHWAAPVAQGPEQAKAACSLADMQEQMLDALQGWGTEWSPQESGFVIALDTAQYFQKIDIHMQPKGVVSFQSRLTEFTEDALSEDSRLALTDFLLTANTRLRLVRASIIGQQQEDQGADPGAGDHRKQAVVLEVAIPGEGLSRAFIEQALSSLVVAARFTTLEVQALCHADVARAYVKLTREGRS